VTNQKEFRAAIYSVLTFIAVGILNTIVFRFTGYGIPCLIRTITGFKCPGCGMTHAVLAAVRGDFAGAMAFNPLSLTIFPVLCLYMVFRIVKTAKLQKEGFAVWEIILLLIMFVITMGFGIIRNIY